MTTVFKKYIQRMTVTQDELLGPMLVTLLKVKNDKVADNTDRSVSVDNSNEMGSETSGPLKNTIMSLDVEVKCIGLTPLRGYDKFD